VPIRLHQVVKSFERSNPSLSRILSSPWNWNQKETIPRVQSLTWRRLGVANEKLFATGVEKPAGEYENRFKTTQNHREQTLKLPKIDEGGVGVERFVTQIWKPGSIKLNQK
jgi:hypothetical protein